MIQRPWSAGVRRRGSALGQSLRWTETPYPLVIKPTTLSPGTGVQHLENFTRQFDSPSTISPFSLLDFWGVGRPSWAARAAASWAAFSTAAARLICKSSSRMRLTTFSAVQPP